MSPYDIGKGHIDSIRDTHVQCCPPRYFDILLTDCFRKYEWSFLEFGARFIITETNSFSSFRDSCIRAMYT